MQNKCWLRRAAGKEMKFHITELEESGKELIASKLDKIPMECSK